MRLNKTHSRQLQVHVYDCGKPGRSDLRVLHPAKVTLLKKNFRLGVHRVVKKSQRRHCDGYYLTSMKESHFNACFHWNPFDGKSPHSFKDFFCGCRSGVLIRDNTGFLHYQEEWKKFLFHYKSNKEV